jgi:protein-disulfide isomerase
VFPVIRPRIALVLGAALGLLAGVPALRATQSRAPKKVTTPAVQDAPPVKAYGSKNAPITMEVFSDFQCPACRVFYEGSMRPLMDEYVSTGKVYLIHRDFPLPIAEHKHSREAARYATAAASIGKLEKVEAVLYDKQTSWGTDGKIDATVATVLTPAEMKRVRLLVEGGKMDSYIDSDVALGTVKGVRQTPSIFVTHAGTTYPLPPGGATYTLLKRFLDDLLRH